MEAHPFKRSFPFSTRCHTCGLGPESDMHFGYERGSSKLNLHIRKGRESLLLDSRWKPARKGKKKKDDRPDKNREQRTGDEVI